MKKYVVEVIDSGQCYDIFEPLFDAYKRETKSNLTFYDSIIPENHEKYELECIVPHLDTGEDVYVISKDGQGFLIRESGLNFFDQEMDIDYVDLKKYMRKYIGPQVGSDEDVEWTKVCSGDVVNTTPSFICGAGFSISDSISKTQIIERLKFYLADYELTESDDSMRKVINWFINCSQGYEGDMV